MGRAIPGQFLHAGARIVIGDIEEAQPADVSNPADARRVVEAAAAV